MWHDQMMSLHLNKLHWSPPIKKCFCNTLLSHLWLLPVADKLDESVWGVDHGKEDGVEEGSEGDNDPGVAAAVLPHTTTLYKQVEVHCPFLTENGTKKMKKNTFVDLEVRMIYTNGGGLSWQVHSLTGQKYKHINKCQAVHILCLIGLNIIYTVDSTMVHSFTHQLCN